MITYLIMRNPGHNRVYFKNSEKLALAELKLTLKNFDQNSTNICKIVLSKIDYLSFLVEKKLNLKATSIMKF